MRPALHDLALREVRERILNRQGSGSGAAIIEGRGIRVALLHGVDETIGADAVIEHSRTTANYQFAVHLVGKSQAGSEIAQRRVILNRSGSAGIDEHAVGRLRIVS